MLYHLKGDCREAVIDMDHCIAMIYSINQLSGETKVDVAMDGGILVTVDQVDGKKWKELRKGWELSHGLDSPDKE